MVSIIVPVYNAERYLEKCVSSILAQTEGDFQLILVDDGSTDASAEICDEFAKKDSRVMVIHQKNAGVSAARNAGLDAACGEYICFVDPDDTLEPDMLEHTTTAALTNGADLVLFDPYVRFQGRSDVSVDSIPFLPGNTSYEKKQISPAQLRFMAGTVWRFLYQRDLIERNKLRFDTTLPLSEDRLFNITAMGCCKKIYYLREPLYHYWINPGSAARKYRTDLLDIVLNTHLKMSRTLELHWGADYLPICEQSYLVDGALICAYNTFSPQSPLTWKRRYLEIKRIVNDPMIRKAYGKLEKPSLRQRMVLNKCCGLLCVTAWLWNMKNSK